MRYEGKVYKIRIYCINGSMKGHRHRAMAKVGGRMLSAEGGTESEAQATLIRLIDPEVEAVQDKNGRRLA
jgi:hypothetical protein